MLYYLATLWPLITLAVIAIPMTHDLLRPRQRDSVVGGPRRSYAVSLAMRRVTRHRFVWVTVLGTQSVYAILATVSVSFDELSAAEAITIWVLVSPFSEFAALVFLVSPLLAALYWLRMKFDRNVNADFIAIALWYAPAVFVSSTMLVVAAVDSEVDVASLSVLASSMALGLGALLVGLRLIRHRPSQPLSGLMTWLMFGLMLQHVVLAWMHIGIPIPHAFVSMLSFGWIHAVWLRESSRESKIGILPRRRGALALAAASALMSLVIASLLRWVFVEQSAVDGFDSVTLLGLDPAMQMVVPSLIGAVALALTVVAGSGMAFRPFLAGLTWSGIWVLWAGTTGLGWQTQSSLTFAAIWFAGVASTMLVVWAVRGVFASGSDTVRTTTPGAETRDTARPAGG